jgi:hypothetical protein
VVREIQINEWQLLPFLQGILAVLFLVFLSLSRNTTSSLVFYRDWLWIPFLLLVLTIFIPVFDLVPGGQDDPDTFPLQNLSLFGMPGYQTAAIISLAFGVIGFFFFGLSAAGSNQAYLPVPSFFSTSLNGGTSWFAFSSGANSIFRGISTATIVSFVEDYVILFGSMGAIWTLLKIILPFFGVPRIAANYVGMVAGVVTSAQVIFPGFHTLAYQGIQPLYERLVFYGYFALIPAALTGFPFSGPLSHIGNNFFFEVGRMSITPVIVQLPVVFGFFMPRNRKGINTDNATKEWIITSRGKK